MAIEVRAAGGELASNTVAAATAGGELASNTGNAE